MTETTSEVQAIRDTVGLYIDGIHNGNVELLKKAFHPRAMMYGASPKSITILEIDGLYGFVSTNDPPAKTGELHQCSILSVQHDGLAATAVMSEKSVFGHDYVNYFQLLKIDGEWKIMSKTYNATPL